MLRRLIFVLPLLCSGAAWAAEVHVVPADPPAAISLAAIAPPTIAATFDAVVYGLALTQSQLDAVLSGVRSIQP